MVSLVKRLRALFSRSKKGTEKNPPAPAPAPAPAPTPPTEPLAPSEQLADRRRLIKEATEEEPDLKIPLPGEFAPVGEVDLPVPPYAERWTKALLSSLAMPKPADFEVGDAQKFGRYIKPYSSHGWPLYEARIWWPVYVSLRDRDLMSVEEDEEDEEEKAGEPEQRTPIDEAVAFVDSTQLS